MPFLDLRASFSSNFASLLSVLRYNSSVFFHLKLYLYGLGKRRPSQCIFFDFRLLAPKVTKFLTPFFRPQVSFPLNFESPFSVITHNSYEIFKILCFGQKEPIKVQFFRFLGTLMSVHPIPQCIFAQDHNFWVYSNFASLFSVMEANSYVFF